MLKVSNLHVRAGGRMALNGLDLHVRAGEIHALMGPNGSGKSSFAKALAGHPDYQVVKGEALFEVNLEPQSLFGMDISDRAKNGVFMAFQYPLEIQGLGNMSFLQAAFNEQSRHQGAAALDESAFKALAEKCAQKIGLDKSFLARNLNEGFSGGEKKQNEILQMLILSPKLAILDETDSGLDVDSTQNMAKGVKAFHDKGKAILLITHYHRIVRLCQPDKVHVLSNGRITQTGGLELAERIEKEGYAPFSQKT